MSNKESESKSKSDPVGNISQETTIPEPPQSSYIPPEQGGDGSSKTNSVRTPLLGYAPTPNIRYEGTQNNEVVKLEVLKTSPQTTTCPHCHEITLSKTEYKSGSCTWLSCMGLFIFVCSSICSFIPFFIDKSKDVTHSCSKCGEVMATYSRLKDKVVLQ